jgi:predicted membrane protein
LSAAQPTQLEISKDERAVKREAWQKILSLKLQKYTSCLYFFTPRREAAHLSPIIHVSLVFLLYFECRALLTVINFRRRTV